MTRSWTLCVTLCLSLLVYLGCGATDAVEGSLAAAEGALATLETAPAPSPAEVPADLPVEPAGCPGGPEPLAVETVESTIPLEPLAPGAFAGKYDVEDVTYVNSADGAKWLFASSVPEYQELRQQYLDTKDGKILPRLNELLARLQSTRGEYRNPLLFTAAPAAPTAGVSCSGGGNSCSCAARCTCVSNANGCSCSCPKASAAAYPDYGT